MGWSHRPVPARALAGERSCWRAGGLPAVRSDSNGSSGACQRRESCREPWGGSQREDGGASIATMSDGNSHNLCAARGVASCAGVRARHAPRPRQYRLGTCPFRRAHKRDTLCVEGPIADLFPRKRTTPRCCGPCRMPGAMGDGRKQVQADTRHPGASTVSDGRACGAIRYADSGRRCTTRVLIPRLSSSTASVISAARGSPSSSGMIPEASFGSRPTNPTPPGGSWPPSVCGRTPSTALP